MEKFWLYILKRNIQYLWLLWSIDWITSISANIKLLSHSSDICFFELQISIWRPEKDTNLCVIANFTFFFHFPPYPGVSNELESCYLIMHMRSESLCYGTAMKFDFTEYWWKEFPESSDQLIAGEMHAVHKG